MTKVEIDFLIDYLLPLKKAGHFRAFWENFARHDAQTSWAIANLFALGTLAARLLDGLFVLCGIVVMVQFIRTAQRVEPFTAPN